MSPYERRLLKQVNKDEAQVRQVWRDSLKSIAESTSRPIIDFTKDDYESAFEISLQSFGLREELLDPSYFLSEREITAREYIDSLFDSKKKSSPSGTLRDDAQPSDSFGINAPLVPPDEDEDEEEENGEEMSLPEESLVPDDISSVDIERLEKLSKKVKDLS